MADFHEYYNGIKKAPIPTIFIGGNHECSTYLKELKYGGWVAPNIYYLGDFGSVWFKGVQICGWSGIFNYHTFVNNKSNTIEKLPYDNSTLRSAYHQKLTNFLKMYMMNHDMDIVLSHDWPIGIEKYGDERGLLRMKPFFKEDIQKGELGSPLNKFLLHYLRPKNWFSGHMHVKFEAMVKDNTKINENELELDMDDDGTSTNKNEISLSMDDDTPMIGDDFESTFHFVEPTKNKKPKTNLTPQRGPCAHDTYFLALDKYGNKRKYFQIKMIDGNSKHPSFDSDKLYYSKRSIAINKVVENYLTNHKEDFVGVDAREILMNPHSFTLVNELMPLVAQELKSLDKLNDDDFIIPENFKKIAPSDFNGKLKYYPNNQTEEYCKKFDIPEPDL
ncbi:hypothetical protein G210_4698 [Candida maltosa Xu316]|uniref:Lariat debranching enzyme C-terminal domain-containing protein n=1 Tax=Candida maltosa (strain Xu316) TaxID=1245528 RepID=M3IUH4_CANMX|nr:hypothetical protein G210_4698 [Candida maltosa Xu316]